MKLIKADRTSQIAQQILEEPGLIAWVEREQGPYSYWPFQTLNLPSIQFFDTVMFRIIISIAESKYLSATVLIQEQVSEENEGADHYETSSSKNSFSATIELDENNLSYPYRSAVGGPQINLMMNFHWERILSEIFKFMFLIRILSLRNL